MRELPDSTLAVLAATVADKKAFTELVRRHRPGLLGFLYRLAGNDSDVEDLAQTAFLKAYDKLSQYRSDASFKTWLFKIAYTEFLQLQRKRKYQNRLESDLTRKDAYNDRISAEESMDLRKGLAELSLEERAAILFCDAVGLSNKDGAQAMAVPLGSIKTYLRRARKKMHIYMEGEKLDDESN